MKQGRRVGGAIVAAILIANLVLQIGADVRAQNDALTIVARGLTTPGGFDWSARDVLRSSPQRPGRSVGWPPARPARLQ